MTDTIEPTEEQTQAAKSFVRSEFGLAPSIQFLARRIARLFAEREAALLALVQHALLASMARAADLDAARARIAELEGRERELDLREAAHLAQIKALREMLVSAPGMEMLTALGDVEGEGAK